MEAQAVLLDVNSQQHTRYYLIDALRGITIISMILYHALFDLVDIFDIQVSWYAQFPGYLWQQSICWSFIFISGISWNFGKNHLKRGVTIFGLGLVITLVTAIISPEFVIIFGILNFLGGAMLLMIPLESYLKKIPSIIGFTISVLLFFLFRNINDGYLGFGDLNLLALPSWLYSIKGFFALGFPEKGFYSQDYFSIFPWLFLYLCGYYFWNLIKTEVTIMEFCKNKVPVLDIIGKNSIWIYLFHQPILLAFFYLLFM